MEELLKRLCLARGISGDEEEVSSILEELLTPYADRMNKDKLGNLIFEKKNDGPHVVLVAHMDEICGMVKHVDNEGFVYFVGIGSHDPLQLFGSRVLVGKNTLGVVQKKKKGNDLKIEDLYIDLGANDIEDVKKAGIGPGSLISRAPSYDSLMGSRRISKSFDNRAGVYVMAETFRRLGNTGCNITAVASCQEEAGLRGAKVLSNYIEADLAIALDVTFAVDTPQRGSPRDINTYLGNGPAITLKDDHFVMSSYLKKFIEKVSSSRRIPLQYDISTGGTDAGPLYLSKGTKHTAPVLIPLRYMHSGNEVLDLDDVENCIKLLIGLIQEIDSNGI